MSKNLNKSDSTFNTLLNFRDMGDIISLDNKEIRKGMIFRSANPDRISRKDIIKLQSLNVRTIVDLRAPHERHRRSKKIDQTEVLSMPLDFQQVTRERLRPIIYRKNSENEISEISNTLYLEILDAAVPVFRQVMEVLVSDTKCPVLIHCQAGKDRTGIICALVLLSLGVERQLIIKDFMKSNDALLPYFKRLLLLRKILSFGFFPSRRMLFAISVRRRNIESVLDRVENHYGGIEFYLKRSGFDLTLLKELREKIILD